MLLFVIADATPDIADTRHAAIAAMPRRLLILRCLPARPPATPSSPSLNARLAVTPLPSSCLPVDL